MDVSDKKLIDEAKTACENAYAPYSGFAVGAALLTGSGKIYTGANIENVSYGATVCAERIAVYKAVLCGERELKAIAVTSNRGEAMPCGICRQVLYEFNSEGNMKIYTEREDGKIMCHTLRDLMPCAFTLSPKGMEVR